ncbi:hypothetical protein FHL15_003183 [Xylaria flabelliformis]|uniref:BZIP domain-containing protein n=1 Tax=Xylaria flabelliformis TaxID=2512241 RepID=A0A553I759_9PEZI|nr:hypothetical protein FHL15_003183 [Xylaria flabelliformis]
MELSVNDGSHITDVAERRKIQNRIAQRNWRTRQKKRIRLANAVLEEMPHLNSFIQGVSQNNFGSHQAVPVELNSFFGRGSISSASRSHRAVSDKEEAARNTPASQAREQPTNQSERPTGSEADCPRFWKHPRLTTLEAGPFDLDSIEHDNDLYSNFDLALEYTENDTDLIDPALSRPRSNAGRQITPVSFTTRNKDWTRKETSSTHNPGFDMPCAFSRSSSSLAPSPWVTCPHTPVVLPQAASDSLQSAADSPGLADQLPATSPLLTAISLGNYRVVRLLIRSGANIDTPDQDGMTPLHLAVQRGDLDRARALLDLGADVMTVNVRGRGLLHTAIVEDQRPMVSMLLSWCAERSKKGEKKPERSDDMPSAEAGIDADEEDGQLIHHYINAQDSRKLTAVHLCVLLNRLEILETLLNYGADVNLGCEGPS